VYKITILHSCRKYLEKLQSHEFHLVSRSILELEQEPRPRGAAKLQDSNYWRIRKGDYRIIYLIDDQNKRITVTRIGHRREIYRDL
jgi:mRNA interferase RelE/StbE